MTADGTLYTRTGKGTYVAGRKIEQPMHRLPGFTQDMLVRGMRPASRVLSQELLPASSELRAGTRDRARLGDRADPPPSHLSHALCPGLLEDDLAETSLYDVLRSRYRVTLGSTRQTIEAAQPVAEERQLLDLPQRVPVLRIHRLTSGSYGRIVEFVRAAYRGDRYQLTVELR